MTTEISKASRFRLRKGGPLGNNARPAANRPRDEGLFNMLLYVKQQTDQTLEGTLQHEMNATRMQGDLMQDFVQDPESGVVEMDLKCNTNARQLMKEYDESITLGRALIDNYEIPEPWGKCRDMDWLGWLLWEEYGTGWCGDVVVQPHGTTFTKYKKNKVVKLALDHASVGWRSRWRYMMLRHQCELTVLSGTEPQQTQVAATRLAKLNIALHGANLIRDSQAVELTANLFKDVQRPEQDDNYIKLFELAYGLPHPEVVQMRILMENETTPKDLVAIYEWIVDYSNRYGSWFEEVCQTVRNDDRLRRKAKRWMGKINRVWKHFLRYFRELHQEACQHNKIGRLRHRNMSFCIKSVTALVRSCRMRDKVATRYRTKYDPPETFPGIGYPPFPDLTADM
ncbi:hypothetical protein GGR50DRAFT_136611 [Xylaria sp. CBS 124048]|nr:hypothetical protein GGR50DRAFT_136611 [Xylaria sp. CBS 124048]